MYTLAFWRELGERALRAAAAALMGVFVGDKTVATVDWRFTAAAVATAVLVSVCSSLLASRRTEGDEEPRTASFLTGGRG
ncbi:holin [Mycobacteroides abscessus]|uniref:holin n=1 Tax=Mycobacteroides abscessus TaxID=36809 RepID=UPI0009281A2D|nr:holin [Mycobacteroides abscessus]SHP54329.1 Uncharacterised protein [Mycobacteroides abscessus subsp. abscessus]SLD61432.1 Uncharacterised protein [Mycobacteroides abscessus subsp. abscessus]